jgi:hypothetical protein
LVAGFTLPETLIAMTLSVFVISILFFSHQLLVRQTEDPKNQLIDSILFLKVAVENRVDYSNCIYQEGNDLLLVSFTDTQHFSFNENTIELTTGEKQEVVFSGEYEWNVNKATESELVTGIMLTIYRDTLSYSFTVHKAYKPFQLLNQKKVDFAY